MAGEVGDRAVEHLRRATARYPPAALATVGVALLAGVALRVWVLASPLGAADLDEATVGLQAQAFLDGRFEAFFRGQDYGGTAETGLVALVFAVLGPGRVALKLVPATLHLVACTVVWRVACRLSCTVLGQLAPPVLLWLGPAYGVWHSTKERGFIGVGIILSALVLLLVLRLDRSPATGDVALLGLVLGLSAWTTPLLAATVLPPVGWLAVRRPALWRLAPRAVGPALVGAAPWLAWNVRNGWASLDAPPGFGSTWFGRLGDWTGRLTTITGFATPYDPGRRLLPQALALAVLVVLLALATRATRRTGPGLLATVVLGFGVLQSFNGLAIAVGPDPRYLYPLLPALALTVGMALAPVGRPGRPAVVELGAVAAAALLLSVWGVAGFVAVADDPRPPGFVASPGVEDVVALLEDRGVDAVTTDVAGHQITFASDGEIAASTYGVPRFDDVERAAARRGRCTYVMRSGRLGGDEVQALVDHLRRHDVGLERRQVGAFTVLFLDEPVRPSDVPLAVFGGAAEPSTIEPQPCPSP